MVFLADELSSFEYCPRLPQIERVFEPPLWPIRDGVKMAFERGIRTIMAHGLASDARRQFIDEAANPGFEYPQGEPYYMANDFADWLEGALEMVKETAYPMTQLDVLTVGEHQLHVEAWILGDTINIFRPISNLDDRYIKWPELAALALTNDRQVFIHLYYLPSARAGRLVTPLSICYRHPSPRFANTAYRLARLEGESFGPRWIKTGRWEIDPPVTWAEWRRGIDKDNCMDSIRAVYSLGPISDVKEKETIKFDLANMMRVMEMPNVWPVFREACQTCVFAGLCHGDEESRKQYRPDPEAIEKYQKKLLDSQASV